MNYKAITSLVAAGGLLLGAACGDDDDQATVNSSTGSLDGSGAESQTTDTGETGEESGDAGSSIDSDSGGTPQDQQLDLEMRHVGGTTITVQSIAFEGDNIQLELEVFNGSAAEIELHNPTWAENTLRLVDDAGNNYNFAQPADADTTNIVVAQGEAVDATLEFLGPLVDQSDQLRLVANVPDGEVEDWDTSYQSAEQYWPEFVIPIDMEWG